MVALNTAYVRSRNFERSKNRVGDFFYKGADCIGQNSRSTRSRIREKRGCNYDIASSHCYGPFGELIRATGEKKDDFNFRFSTKYEDAETGLLYYGYRYYNAETGRWLNRDPIEEQGGLNLYSFVGNDAVNVWDYLGMKQGNVKIDSGAVRSINQIRNLLNILERTREECACYPDVEQGIIEFRRKLLDRKAFKNYFDMVDQIKNAPFDLAKDYGNAVVAAAFTRDFFGVELVNQITLEDTLEFNDSVKRITGVVDRITTVGEIITERDAFDLLGETLNLGLEYGFNKIPKAGIFPLYHGDAVLGIGRAWQEAGLNKLPELAGRLEVACFGMGEQSAKEALRNMENFTGTNLWDRIWGR